MGQVIAFRKPLAMQPSFHEGGADALDALAQEIYNQCHIHALTEAFNAKRANPELELKRLIPGLTEHFAQEVIADKVFRAGVEQNMQKLYLAEALQNVVEARHGRTSPLMRN